MEETHYKFLRLSSELADQCPSSAIARSVGAVLVCLNGEVFTGYSRERTGINHAEEEAITKALESGKMIKGATLYSSLEPCSQRSTNTHSCSELIIKHGVKRIIFSEYDKGTDACVPSIGAERIKETGIEVVYLPFNSKK